MIDGIDQPHAVLWLFMIPLAGLVAILLLVWVANNFILCVRCARLIRCKYERSGEKTYLSYDCPHCGHYENGRLK